MEEQKSQPLKWEGKATAKLNGGTADQIWSLLLNDFCDIQKWLPSVETCRKIDGVTGKPGCIRYTAGSALAPAGEPVGWATEKLVDVDSSGRSYTYEVIDSNIGLDGYTSTIKVLTDSGDQLLDSGGGGGGCVVEQSFMVGCREGWSCEGIVSYLELSLQAMAKKMEESFATH